MPPRIRVHIEERQLQCLSEVGPARDNIVLTNPYILTRSCEFTNSQTARGGVSDETNSPCARKVFCRYCKRNDHELNQCPKLANRRPAYLPCELVTGYVTLAVVDKLPASGISLLLGNDLAGDLMRPYLVVSPHPTGACPLLSHDVLLSDHALFRQGPYRINSEKREFLEGELRRLKEQGMIRPSLIPWASLVVLVLKELYNSPLLVYGQGPFFGDNMAEAKNQYVKGFTVSASRVREHSLAT
ncbi:hypothetical protein O3P69_009021 [Scylla paramamosain]|uniref:Uncharacterized protein n=1 Tax=Scylla paramamosain TaxID=85552 RepID=A0AAW0TQI2_SCYPA